MKKNLRKGPGIQLIGRMILITLMLTWLSLSHGSAPAGASEPEGVEMFGKTYPSLGDFFYSDEFKVKGARCGTMQKRWEKRHLLSDALAPTDCDLNQSINLPAYAPVQIFMIPVWVHVIRRDDGYGDVSDDLIESQMDVLNEDYRALAGTLGARGVDTMIQFFLAGATRYNDTAAFNDLTEDYKKTMGKDQKRFLNIYTNSASGYLGYAYLPQDSAGQWWDGVVILWSVFGRDVPGAVPYDLGRTVTHEVGHYLGLLHPFDGGCVPIAIPACYSNGDLICDTLPQEFDLYGCPVGSVTCGSPDPIHNYMNYTDDFCMEQFTPEQMLRMRCAMENYRPDLYNSSWVLTIQKDGAGTGVVTGSPPGIDCGPDCTQILADGTEATLSAGPDPGSALDGWTGANCPGNGICRLLMHRDYTVTATFNPDKDNDGISDITEDAGPYNGDGNLDGLPDSEQANVATFKNITGGWCTLTAQNDATLQQVAASVNPSPKDAPTDAGFPIGFFGFTVRGLVPGASTVVYLTCHDKADDLNNYYRHGPTPDNDTAHWYEFDYDEDTGVVINQEDFKTVMAFHFIDGQRGDDDLTADGVIQDLGGPAGAGPSGGNGGGGGCFISAGPSEKE